MSVSSNILAENSCNLGEEVPFNEEFPASIRVLLVDADSNSLLFLKNLIAPYFYQVTIYDNGVEAMAFLKKSKHEIDLVIWDFYMPDITGPDALITIGKEMDLPVVIMSSEHKTETVVTSFKYGACDFLVKPVSKEVIVVLWRHVLLKRMSKPGLYKPGESATVVSAPDGYDDLEPDNLNQGNEEGTSDQKRDTPQSKKRRMTWTSEFRNKFEEAVRRLGGPEKAFPKHILKYMQEQLNVEGLTRNNVSSHLQQLRWQKYRLSYKRARTPQETQEDFGYRNAAPVTACNPALSSSFNFHSIASYMTNEQAASRASYMINSQAAPRASYMTNVQAAPRASYMTTNVQAAPRASYSMNEQAAPRASYMTSNEQAAPRASYSVNEQAVLSAPIQYSSNSYMPMNNNSLMTNQLAYIDQFQQPQQQYHHSLDIPSMQEPGHVPLTKTVSLAEENFNPLIFEDFPCDLDEYFTLQGINNLDGQN